MNFSNVAVANLHSPTDSGISPTSSGLQQCVRYNDVMWGGRNRTVKIKEGFFCKEEKMGKIREGFIKEVFFMGRWIEVAKRAGLR